MKKFIFIAILVNLFYSCQNLNSLINKNDKPELNMQVDADKVLTQESFFLSDSGVAYFLDIVSGNIKNNVTRSYVNGNAFDLYLGEYIAIPTTAYNCTVIATPTNVKSYEAFVRGGVFYFRSLYQGKFGFVLEKYGEQPQTIVINNKSRYQISSFDLNDLVNKNMEEHDIGKLKNSVQAFKILFPDNPRVKEVSFALFNQGVINNDKQVVINEGNFLEENCQLTSEDKVKILLGKEKVLQSDYGLSKVYLTFSENTPELNDAIKNDIIKRGKPTPEELRFLEECYSVRPNRELANALGIFYYRQGNISKGTHYSENKEGVLPKPLINGITENIMNGVGETVGELTDSTETTTSTEEIIETVGPNQEYENFLSDYNKAVNYYNGEDYGETILILEDLLKDIKPEYKEVQDIYYILGNSYYITKSLNKANEYFEKVEKENKNYPEAQYKLGDIYFKQGDKSKAIKTFENVKNNYNSTVWGRRSIIYLRSLK